MVEILLVTNDTNLLFGNRSRSAFSKTPSTKDYFGKAFTDLAFFTYKTLFLVKRRNKYQIIFFFHIQETSGGFKPRVNCQLTTTILHLDYCLSVHLYFFKVETKDPNNSIHGLFIIRRFSLGQTKIKS